MPSEHDGGAEPHLEATDLNEPEEPALPPNFANFSVLHIWFFKMKRRRESGGAMEEAKADLDPVELNEPEEPAL